MLREQLFTFSAQGLIGLRALPLPASPFLQLCSSSHSCLSCRLIRLCFLVCGKVKKKKKELLFLKSSSFALTRQVTNTHSQN